VAVALDPEIEPLVRLLEETPRARVVETFAARVRDGLAYEQLLAVMLLAGVRNVEPRPSVGFKFHAVLVAQSVHLACIHASDEQRWLPLFWALDYFKSSQARDEQERGWTMGPVDEAAVPAADAARSAFVTAMDQWDEAAADAAVAGLARTARPADIWELFFRYGARDFRSIGHKAIDVANSHRTLGVIGWKHAEPALRSLAYALLMHEGGNPAERDDSADRPGRENLELARQFPTSWQQGEPSAEATRDLLTVIRNGTEREASRCILQHLKKGAAPASLWDGLLLAAVELLVRQPGIVALHAVTTTNALYYAFRHAREDRSKRYVLLQNAAFLPMFREAMRGRGKVGEFALDQLQPERRDEAAPVDAEQIFETLGRNRLSAARQTLSYFKSDGPLTSWQETALRLVIDKGRDAHDYKFGCAVLEDATSISPQWQAHFLAAALFKLQAATQGDNPLITRAREALAG
jgi:hypothetical protein